MTTWKNRVVEYTTCDPEELMANPRNARFHPGRQREVMRAVLGEIGWVAPVIENITTGCIIDGHMRCEEALSAGVPRIPVLRVELSEDEEAEALITFDGIGQLTRWEQDRLDDLIATIDTPSAAIDELLQDLAKTAVDLEPEPLPEVEDEIGTEVRSLCAVYPAERYREVIEALGRVPGDSVGQKLSWLLARYA